MRTNEMTREKVFVPKAPERAFRTRTPGFLGGTGRTRDAASLGLQASIAGPLGARTRRGQPFARPPTPNRLQQQLVQGYSQMLGSPNQGVADISKGSRPVRDMEWTNKGPVHSSNVPIGVSKPLLPAPTGVLGPPPESTKYAKTAITQPLNVTRLRGVYSGR